MLSLFKMTPKCIAEVSSGVPMCKSAVMSLSEKINVLGRLCSGMSYISVGCEFNVNGSIIHTE